MHSNDLHFSNAPFPISSSLAPRVAVVNPVQQLNAPFPIDLTALGMTMRCSHLQYLNSHTPISSSPLPRAAVVNPEQLLNAQALRGREKLLDIDCTQIAINWNCIRGKYLELQFLGIAK
jgi:hypothetical protein